MAEGARRKKRGDRWVKPFVILLLIGLGLFALSEVFRTKVIQLFERYGEWTDERIASDPKGWLRFLELKTSEAMERLDAATVATKQNLARIEGLRAQSRQKIAADEHEIRKLVETWGRAERERSWPVEWQGKTRDRDWFRNEICGREQLLETRRKFVERCDEGTARMERQTLGLQETRIWLERRMLEIKEEQSQLPLREIKEENVRSLVALRSTFAPVLNWDESASLVMEGESPGYREDAFDRILDRYSGR